MISSLVFLSPMLYLSPFLYTTSTTTTKKSFDCAVHSLQITGSPHSLTTPFFHTLNNSEAFVYAELLYLKLNPNKISKDSLLHIIAINPLHIYIAYSMKNNCIFQYNIVKRVTFLWTSFTFDLIENSWVLMSSTSNLLWCTALVLVEV